VATTFGAGPALSGSVLSITVANVGSNASTLVEFGDSDATPPESATPPYGHSSMSIPVPAGTMLVRDNDRLRRDAGAAEDGALERRSELHGVHQRGAAPAIRAPCTPSVWPKRPEPPTAEAPSGPLTTAKKGPAFLHRGRSPYPRS